MDCLPLPGVIYIIEPPHDKTNKMACAHSEDSVAEGDMPFTKAKDCIGVRVKYTATQNRLIK